MTKFVLFCSAVLFTIGTGCAAGSSSASKASLQPPVHTQMLVERMHDGHVDATLRVCIDDKGTVESVDVVESSGISDYDKHLVEVASAWTYSESEGDACRLVTVEYEDKA